MPEDKQEPKKAGVRYQSATTVAAGHGEFQEPEFPVAPSTSAKDTVNTIRPSLIPWACWKVEDICFDFGRAFVRPDAKESFVELANLLKEYPKSAISIFGHADPVGDDQANKDLSERRAKAVYAVLIRNVALWEEIYAHKHEGLKLVQNTLDALGHSPGAIDGKIGPNTRTAIKAFEKKAGRPEKGADTPDMRAELFKTYMDELSPSLTLTQGDFLAGGQCAYQGCGEFNPVRMFSKSQNQFFAKKENRPARNDENQPNRRVVAYLFRPGTKVNAQAWPCRSDLASCQKRLWSDFEERRTFQEKGREHSAPVEEGGGTAKKKWTYEPTRDTFACRFYERLAYNSPCEQPVLPRPGPFVQFEFLVFDHPTCGVACQVMREAPPEADAKAVQREVLSHVGNASATNISATGDQEKARDVHGKKFDVSSDRKHVMKAKGSPPMGKSMHGDAVVYDTDYYVSELAHVVPYIVDTEDKYKTQCKIFETTEDQHFDTNEVVVLWDKKRQKVAKYMLDGEEFVLE